MATLAPTISHTLAIRNADSAMANGHCDMPSMASMPMGSMGSMDSTASMPSMHRETPLGAAVAVTSTDSPVDKHTQPSQHTSLTDGDACGYCSLLAHMPVVPSVETLFAVAVLVRQHVVATRFESVLRVEPLTFAQPRAPPFSS